jgi:hypothetical protein
VLQIPEPDCSEQAGHLADPDKPDKCLNLADYRILWNNNKIFWMQWPAEREFLNQLQVQIALKCFD